MWQCPSLHHPCASKTPKPSYMSVKITTYIIQLTLNGLKGLFIGPINACLDLLLSQLGVRVASFLERSVDTCEVHTCTRICKKKHTDYIINEDKCFMHVHAHT